MMKTFTANTRPLEKQFGATPRRYRNVTRANNIRLFQPDL
jgi:hypothetical protein